MVGHVVSTDSKRRDPEIMGSEGVSFSRQFESIAKFIWIFANDAKWVPQYSKRNQPLLEDQKQLAFQLFHCSTDFHCQFSYQRHQVANR